MPNQYFECGGVCVIVKGESVDCVGAEQSISEVNSLINSSMN